MPSNTRELLLRGLWAGLLAIGVGLVAYLVSCLVVPPDQVAKGFGIDWQQMAQDPFALSGRLPNRILTPLLAWALGFGSEHYVLFVRGLSVLLLATVFVFGRRRGLGVPDAALITLTVALISPVQMYKLNWVGYCDALTYTLFFWMLLAARSPWVFWSLFFCNLLNHELAGFLLPWLWFVRREADDRWRADVVGAGAAVVLYAAYYFAVKAAAPTQLYSNDYFLSHPLFPGGAFAVGVTAIVHWVVAFGPILAVLAWHQHAPTRGRERWHLWLVLLGIAVIFCIAFDWSRHSNLLVLPLVIASVRFLQPGPLQVGHRLAFVGLTALGAALMVVWPPWPSVSWPTVAFTEPQLLVDTHVVVSGPNNEPGFGTLSAATNEWLPRVWPTLWPILCVVVAIWCGGALLARWRPADEPLQQSAPLQ